MAMQRPPKVVAEKHEHYRTINVNGFYGGHRPGFFEAVVYTDEMITEEALSSIPPDSNKIKIKRTLQARLVIDPFQAKSFLKWLSEHTKQYETTFGKIPDLDAKLKGLKGKDSAIYT